MDAITRMRVEACVKMKEAHAEDFTQFEECWKLLKEVCRPGSDLRMDGDPKESPSGQGFCSAYFEQSRQMALESAKECVEAAEESRESEEYKKCIPVMEKLCRPGADMMMDHDKKEESTGKGYCQKFFPAEEEEEDDKEEEGKEEGEKDGKKDGKSKEEKEGAQKDTEKGGKKNETDGQGEKGATEEMIKRMHMDESIGVPEQGFEGPRVEHDGGKTRVDDWSAEYGPKHPVDIEEICKKDPGNAWCKDHRKKPCASQNAAVAAKVCALALALPLAVLLGRIAP